jgi:hypothetical protein
MRPRSSGSVELACSISARIDISITNSRAPNPTSGFSDIITPKSQQQNAQQ